MEDFNRKGYQDCPEPVSCTSRLSAWNVPASLVSVNPASIDQTVIRKIKFGKDNDNFNQAKYLCYDPRKHTDRQVNEKSLKELQSKLASCLFYWFFFAFHHLQDSSTSNEQQIVTETISSLMSPFVDSTVILTDSLESQAFNDTYDISCKYFKEMMDYYCLSHLSISDDEILGIEEKTHGQASNEH